MVPTGKLKFIALPVVAAALGHTAVATAQTADPNSGRSLPAVTVDAPKKRIQSHRVAAQGGRANRAARRAQSSGARPPIPAAVSPIETLSSKGTFQQGNGPIEGYVPHRSLVGTKTNTPLLEVPQAISVVGREQMHDQGAQTAVQALGYTAGVATNNDPNDTRFESLLIRARRTLLLEDHTPAEVLATPAVREVFLGSDVTASLAGGTLDEGLIQEDSQ